MFTPYAQTAGHLPPDKELKKLLAEARAVLKTLTGISDCHTAAQKFVEVTGKGKAVRGTLPTKAGLKAGVSNPVRHLMRLATTNRVDIENEGAHLHPRMFEIGIKEAAERV